MHQFKVGEIVEFEGMPELKYRIRDVGGVDDLIALTSLATEVDFEIQLQHLQEVLRRLPDLGCLVTCGEVTPGGLRPWYESKQVSEREKEIMRKADECMKNHKLKVLHESEYFRQYRYGKEGTCDMQFDLIFFRGSMLVQGDMGEYWWQRTADMRAWASGAVRSLGYFAEKLIRDLKVKQFDSKLAVEFVRYTFAEKLEQLIFDSSPSDLKPVSSYPYQTTIFTNYEKLKEQFEELMSKAEEQENSFYDCLYSAQWVDELPELEVYTYHFLWIRRGVQRVLAELDALDDHRKTAAKAD